MNKIKLFFTLFFNEAVLTVTNTSYRTRDTWIPLVATSFLGFMLFTKTKEMLDLYLLITFLPWVIYNLINIVFNKTFYPKLYVIYTFLLFPLLLLSLFLI